jgi:DNA polymerase-3 subunit epsilon
VNLQLQSNLLDRAYRILKGRPEGLSINKLACRVLQAERLSDRIIHQVIEPIFLSDERFIVLDGLCILSANGLDELKNTTFVAVDIETTGGSASSNRIIEIGAVKIRNGQIIAEFSTLVNPEKIIPPFITTMTGITNEMVVNAPSADKVLSEFLKFLSDDVFVAHNSAFDLSFINHELEFYGFETLDNEVMCTCRLARRNLPQLKSKNLDAVAKYFDLEISNRHRALSDAKVCALILNNFLEIAKSKGVNDLDEFIASQFAGKRPSDLQVKTKIKSEFLSSLPEKSGVYLMKDDSGEIIYVGKAVNLKSRVRSYFHQSAQNSKKVQRLIRSVDKIEYILTGSELSALLLESKLIKEHQPHFNTLIKRYKKYPFIKINLQKDFPRLEQTTEILDDGAEYFGPFRDRYSVELAIETLNKLFKLCQCEQDWEPNPFNKPCFYYQIERCYGPNACLISKEDYKKVVNEALVVLSGKAEFYLENLKKEMERLSDELRFEQAGTLRDRIYALENIIYNEKLIINSLKDNNLVIVMPGRKEKEAELFFVQRGRLAKQVVFLNKDSNLNENRKDLKEILSEIYNEEEMSKLARYGKAEIDEVRIISTWLYRNKNKRQVIHINGKPLDKLIERILKMVENVIINNSQ